MNRWLYKLAVVQEHVSSFRFISEKMVFPAVIPKPECYVTRLRKTIIRLVAILAITLSFITTSHAISVVNHLITDDPKADTGCTIPTAKNVFSTNDARVYSWALVSQAIPLDILTWKWIAPDNSLYASLPWTVGLFGSGCGYSWITIKDQPPASKTGLWKAEIYNGSTLVASDAFTIQNPSPPPLCTYTFSAWGPCQPVGTQERTITSSSPAGCIEWLPQLTQACTYVPPPLAAPKNLRYTFINNILTINWDSVAGAVGYKLGLGTQAGKYDNVNNLGNTIQIGPADVRTAAPGTYNFYLAVKAYSGSQESAYSNEIFLNVTVAGPSIEAPKNLRYSTQGNMMTILWDAVSAATGYKVGIGMQSSKYSGPYDLGKATQIGPFDVASVPSGTYYLAAKAYKGSYESAYSNEIAVAISPRYNLSDDQKDLIGNYGNPKYFSILFNTGAQRREEIWVYTGQKRMYVFWDGMRTSEKELTLDPAAAFNPASLDPSIFTKNTTMQDLIQTLGNNYTEVDQSSLNGVLNTTRTKTYKFTDKGLYVMFVDSLLVVVKNIDIPIGK